MRTRKKELLGEKLKINAIEKKNRNRNNNRVRNRNRNINMYLSI